MKRNFFLFLMAFLFLGVVNAQRVITEDFEDDLRTDPNKYWEFYEYDADDHGFVYTENEKHNGTSSFYHSNDDNVWSIAKMDSWMVSAAYYFIDDAAKLIFWHYVDTEAGGWFTSDPDVSIWITTDNNPANSDKYTKISDFSVSEDAWGEFTWDIPDTYKNKTLYIAFKYSGDNDYPLYVDEFSFGAAAPLPIVLSDFKGNALATKNSLTWATESEINASHFEVMKSLDGVDFEVIGEVDAAGNASRSQEYHFEDEDLNSLAYYRLKMVDLDGSFKYSEVISLVHKGAGFGLLGVYPVPARTSLTVKYSTDSEGEISLMVVDLMGRVVLSEQIDSNEGVQKHSLDISNIPEGTYILTVTDGQTIETQRIVKL